MTAPQKRLHIHLKVDDLDRSAQYYEALLGRPPTKRAPDYAKWLLDEPAANIALSTHGLDRGRGIDHVGVQFANADDMAAAAARLRKSGAALIDEPGAACCYARSDKFWSRDHDGALWELFHTTGERENYGAEPDFRPDFRPDFCIEHVRRNKEDVRRKNDDAPAHARAGKPARGAPNG